MKKKLLFLSFLFLLVLIISSCSPGGTTISKIAAYDGWIYYAHNEENALYRMRPDGSEKIKLPGGTDFMQFDGDYVYYFMENGGIGRTNLDDSQIETISEGDGMNTFGFYVSGDWVFLPEKDGTLSRIKTDGSDQSEIAKLTDFQGEFWTSVSFLFFNDSKNTYRMNFDGTGTERISDRVFIFYADDEWIYYSMANEKGEPVGTYRMMLDGSQSKEMSDGVLVDMDEDKLYFVKKDGFYRSNLDGSSPEKLNEEEMWQFFCVCNDQIFFGEYSGAAYRMNLDGSNKVRIE